jgi:hypothetical protein
MAEVTEAKTPDWAIIEADYRAGIKVLRTIAAEHGLSEGAIRKRAKKEDWARDLSAKIREQADALVRKEAVRSEVRKTEGVPERVVVEANAAMQYQIRMEHRADISRSRKLFQGLLGEMELLGVEADQIERLFDEVHKEPGPDASAGDRTHYAKMAKLLNDVLSIPGRVDSGKKIVEMLKNLVALEREAFGIDDKRGGPSTGDISISF